MSSWEGGEGMSLGRAVGWSLVFLALGLTGYGVLVGVIGPLTAMSETYLGWHFTAVLAVTICAGCGLWMEREGHDHE